MNPLEKHPHLFANGKFKAKAGSNSPIIIIGIKDNRLLLGDGHWAYLHNCTLIARPISDMTDDEKLKSPMGETLGVDYVQMCLQEYAKHDPFMMYTGDFMSLLSIGVYPFDQSHFEDGTVIDATEKQPA